MTVYRNYNVVQGSHVPWIEGSGGGGGCFPAGALVSTPEGAFPIETLKIGDAVHCFDDYDSLCISYIEKVWKHIPSETVGYIITVTHETGKFRVTDNHYLYDKNNEYKETKDWKVGEELTLKDNSKSKILHLESEPYLNETVYNLTIKTHHNYVCEGIRLSNKGGGKGGAGGAEDPNTLFSTDILFVTVALGEGPVYRINPNGPQDIELNDGNVDDLIKLDSDGTENTDLFVTRTRTGTIDQTAMRQFGDQIVTPQSLQNAVNLKKGNVEGVPRAAVDLQSTSASDWDKLRFTFALSNLQQQDDNGNIKGYEVEVKITVFNAAGTTEIASATQNVNGKTNVPYKFQVVISIPEASKSTNGYKFTVEKTSDDSDESKKGDNVQFTGWDEIEEDDQAYPRTALIGYAIKSFAEHQGQIPTFTCLVKGLVVKVPSNYNQPILSDGEVDWRQLEVAESGQFLHNGSAQFAGYPNAGYRLQKQGTGTILTHLNPVIYEGVWDGTFVYSWTQNPVWILYDLLTNHSYGLGIPEENIDKFYFYKVAMYCDACDLTTGQFKGVDGFADGTFRHKPRNVLTEIKEVLLGMPRDSKVKERRFTLDITIAETNQVLDIIQRIASTMRSILFYSGGKITLNIDMPDDIPVAIFNDGNIEKESLAFFGTKETDIITGADVTYTEPSNHYKRETIRIDDPQALRDLQQIENITSVELAGVTRRSQAQRHGQYMIASSKYLRRQCSFKTGTDAINLSIGDIIAVSSRSVGVAYGFGGKVAANASVNTNNVLLEHFTSPAITEETILGNTLPLVLRHIGQESDRVEYYTVSNTSYTVSATGNADTGIDLIELVTTRRFDHGSKVFKTTDLQFQANNVPIKGDLWTFGEGELTNFYGSTSDKLFKVTSLSRDEDEKITVAGVEYIPNVYSDSDTVINYTPQRYDDTVSALTAPPAPLLKLQHIPTRMSDGAVRHDLYVNATTDKTGYPLYISTQYQIARPIETVTVTSQTASTPLTMTSNNNGLLANGQTATLTGKNGFRSVLGNIPVLVEQTAVVDSVSGVSNGNILLSISGLPDLYDENFEKHMLLVNDGITTFSGLKGFDHITIPINEKANTGSEIGFIGFGSRLVEFSANVVDANVAGIANSKIKIQNEHSGGTKLSEILDSTPFYATLGQILTPSNFAANSIYLTGTSLVSSVTNANITAGISGSGTFTQPLETVLKYKEQVRVFVDGIEKSTSEFSLDSGNSSVVVSGLGGTEQVCKTIAEVYTVPSVEIGDNIQFSTGNVYSVVNTSYYTGSETYNATVTANQIYRVQVKQRLSSNASGVTAVNISPDITFGTINNVEGSTFTIDYNPSLIPGTWNLANHNVYSVSLSAAYESLTVPQDRIIKAIGTGTTIIRARNVNTLNRRSAYSTQAVVLDQIPIQKVTDLSFTESLYRDTTVGVAVRAIVSFTHITNQEITGYEISYRVTGELTDLTSFNTVIVPAAGVDNDGKIRYTINNIDRGSASSVNTLIVRVTPLNNDIRGVSTETQGAIIGKSAPPLNITDFAAGQLGDTITLFWQYVTTASGELFDLDLKDVIIKRFAGEVQEANFETAYQNADPFVTVSAGSTRKARPIDTFGTFTYLAKTRDTSGNLSSTVVGVAITTNRTAIVNVFKTYSEDSPGGNVVSGKPNDNRTETNFPSFANSNTGGLVSATFNASTVDNANGTSSGWSVVGGAPTDLQVVGASAYYQTQVRDIVANTSASITANVIGDTAVTTTWNTFRSDVASGVTEVSSDNTFLIDTACGGAQGLGTVLGFSNSAAAAVTYDETTNKTLISGGTLGNVFAIWNEGQFASDVSNDNSYALIAAVVNANAVKLGATYFANGEPTGTNAFANLTSVASSYKLVDLSQYVDSVGTTTTFAGDSSTISSNLLMRVTDTNPYFANGNVDVTTFGGVSPGWVGHSAGFQNFRWFQLQYNVTNSNPAGTNFLVDRFEYTVDKQIINFTVETPHTATSDEGGNTFIDYSAAGYSNIPSIQLTVLESANALAAPTAVVIGRTDTGANINVIFASNSQPAVGDTVLATITGV